ncbi:hypothetical protein OHS59_44295 [Streptomyces sp. NBC_00414]|uniref:hypothetical protein n=1 Tax=Streptomyces sp. NBC_00414 TaxID=2975739 RepID=UPI002E2498A0
MPLNSPLTPQDAPEYLVAAAIEHAGAQNWQLDSVSTYGSTYQDRGIGSVSDAWALLWLRSTVLDRGWNNSTADKGGFIQEATGWKPSPKSFGQPACTHRTCK